MPLGPLPSCIWDSEAWSQNSYGMNVSYGTQKMDYDGMGEKQGVKCMESKDKSVEYSTNYEMCKSVHIGTTQ